MGQYLAKRDHKGLYMTIQDIMGPYGTVQDQLEVIFILLVVTNLGMITVLMAIQVDESQADKLGHVYSEGERLLCRIQLFRPTCQARCLAEAYHPTLYLRRKQTRECSKLANSGVTTHD